PILVAADAAIISQFVDHCLFFIRWGSTTRSYVANALRRLSLYNVTLSGVVLSHVNVRQHANYAAGEGYYRPYGASAGTPFVDRSGQGRIWKTEEQAATEVG